VQLEHSFTVPVGIEDAWRVLLDIELIAPCMPGAAIDSVDGDDFTGTVKVKLGPIGLTYKGKASWIEKDAVAHRAVIDARGRDARGNGTANAKVMATLTEAGDSTKVDVVTDLDITGKPAQFGRGVMVDVGNKLIGQFADCLAGKLADGAVPAAAPDSTAPDSTAPEAAPQPPAAATDEPAEQARKVTSATKSAATPAGKAAPVKDAPAKAAKAAAKKAPAKKAAAKKAPAKKAAAAKKAEPSNGAAPAKAAETHAKPAMSATSGHATASAAPRHIAPAPRRTADEVEPINLIESAGPAVLKRLAPVIVVVIVAWLVRNRRRRRR
jgi:carbon monoxide dehydrogenase subunit G